MRDGIEAQWNAQWAHTVSELDALNRRFCEIHDLTKAEVVTHDPELKQLRARCIAINYRRIELLLERAASRRQA